jgi:hypothetical protein
MRNPSVRLSPIIVIVALQFVACDQSGGPRTGTPKAAYTLPDQFIFEPSAERGPEGQVFITGHTNLPDGLKIGVEVGLGKYRMTKDLLKIPWKAGYIEWDFQVVISDGRFRSFGLRSAQTPDGKFRAVARGSEQTPIPAGKYYVHFLADFNGAWQSPEILAIAGRGGSNLHGPLFKLEEPDVIDSDKILDCVVTLDFPKASDPTKEARTTPPEPSKEQRAIELAKKAVLVVDGSRSSMTVEDGFAFYRKDPEIRLGSGWSASPSEGNTFLVSLSFINGPAGEDHAIWSVDLSTKKVKYINKAAKAFSWIPAE